MANKNTISVQLTVNDDGSVTMKQFGKTTEETMTKASLSANKAGTAFQSLKTNWMAATAAMTAGTLALMKAWNLAETAAQFEQSQNAFRTMATTMGADADKLYATLREKSAGLIDNKSLTEAANRAMSLGIPIEKLGELMEISRAKARDMGISTTQAFSDIATGIGRGSPMILDNLGLMLKVGSANEELANKLQKTVDELTDKEKQMALLNATVDAGREALDRYDMSVLTTKEKMEKFQATVKNIQLLMGQGLIRAFAGVSGVFQTMAGSALSLAGQLMKLGQGYSWLREKMSFGAESERWAAIKDSFRRDAEAAIAGSNDLWEQAKGNFGAMVASSEELAKAMQKPMDAEVLAARAAEKNAAANKAAADARLKQINAIKDASLKMAEEDKKSLQTQLSGHEQYYQHLQAMMEKNIESERKHLAELQAIRQQRVDVDRSAASLIAGIRGLDESMSMQQRYDSARSGLNQQFSNALDLGGQDRVKALEDYKQAVASLQSQFSKGIPGVKDIFGNVDEVVRAKTIAEDAISDIERATQMQKNALSALAEEKQAQIEADQLWGQTLQTEAQRAQGEMQNLQNIIAAITQQITSMQTTIQLTGVDSVSSVVDEITRKIQALHELAARPIAIGGGGGGMMSDSGGSYAAGNTPLYGTGWDSSSPDIPGYATGTPYVPRTGIYRLHQGEAVIPAEQNKSGGRAVNFNGDIVINVPQSAASGKPEDWRMITRQYIVPELRKLNS